MAKIISAGKIIGAFGILGFVKIKTDSRAISDSLSHYDEIYLLCAGKWVPYKIERYSTADNLFNAKLIGINNRDQAMALRGTLVGIDRDSFPSLKSDEYYWADLLGLEVYNTQQQLLGQVQNLMDSGSNSVLVVSNQGTNMPATTDAIKEYLIPFAQTYIIEVNLEKKQIIVDWGLDY